MVADHVFTLDEVIDNIHLANEFEVKLLKSGWSYISVSFPTQTMWYTYTLYSHGKFCCIHSENFEIECLEFECTKEQYKLVYAAVLNEMLRRGDV